MGASGSSGQEAVANAEINAAVLTARAGARDPSAIPSICRVSAALQYPAGEYIIVSDWLCEMSLINMEKCMRLKVLYIMYIVLGELKLSETCLIPTLEFVSFVPFKFI